MGAKGLTAECGLLTARLLVGLLKENWLDAGDMIGEAGSRIDSTLDIRGKFLYEALWRAESVAALMFLVWADVDFFCKTLRLLRASTSFPEK